MPKSKRRPGSPIRKERPSTAPMEKIHSLAVELPPGIVADRYEVRDLRAFRESSRESDVVTHSVEVWTTRRDRVIDTWLDAERTLRTACVLLLSPTEELQTRLWTLLSRQSGDALIDLLGDLLKAKNHTTPDGFRSHLKVLAKLRNLLAHQASRPREAKQSDDGLVFLRSTGFKSGSYVEVTYEEMDQAIAGVEPLMKWLVAEFPEVDYVSVQLEDEALEDLKAGQGEVGEN